MLQDPCTKSTRFTILGYKKKLFHLNRAGEVIEEIEMDYPDQDMIFVYGNYIYMTIGADYVGQDNYIAIWDKSTHDFSFKYRLIDSYAIEGLVIQDGYLYVANDGLYHKSAIPKTYISKYAIE